MPEPKLDGSVASPARTSDAELCYHPAALAGSRDDGKGVM